MLPEILTATEEIVDDIFYEEKKTMIFFGNNLESKRGK